MHVEHRTPVVLDAVGEAGGAADAGDVDDRVEPAELVDQLREERADGVGVGDRDVRRPGLPAGGDDALRGGLLGVAGAAGVPSTVTPGSTVTTNAPRATELLGDGGADPAAAAGDDGDAHDCVVAGVSIELQPGEVARAPASRRAGPGSRRSRRSPPP